MRDGEIPGLDSRQLCTAVQKAAEHMWGNIASGDWKNRGIEQLSPESYPAYRL